MDIIELFTAAKKGDILTNDSDDVELYFNGFQILTLDGRAALLPAHLIKAKWKIIPAKKEPFKRPIDWFESLHGKHELERMHDSGTVMMAFSAGEKNNALLYADLVEAVQNYIDSFNSDIENKYEIMKQALAALPKSD